MATVEQCEQALRRLSERLDDYEQAHREVATEHPDRTMSCTLRDLDVSFTGRFHNGHLIDIARADAPAANAAQIRVELTSDDLVALVDGHLDIASAWVGGRVKIHAGMRDLLRLRSLF